MLILTRRNECLLNTRSGRIGAYYDRQLPTQSGHSTLAVSGRPEWCEACAIKQKRAPWRAVRLTAFVRAQHPLPA